MRSYQMPYLYCSNGVFFCGGDHKVGWFRSYCQYFLYLIKYMYTNIHTYRLVCICKSCADCRLSVSFWQILFLFVCVFLVRSCCWGNPVRSAISVFIRILHLMAFASVLLLSVRHVESTFHTIFVNHFGGFGHMREAEAKIELTVRFDSYTCLSFFVSF